MLKRVGEKKLGRKSSHRRALIINQVRSLFKSGSVSTTTPKAKVLKANAEKFISKVNTAKDDINLVKYVRTMLGEVDHAKVIKTLKDDKASVSIMKVGFRAGDNAEVSKVVVNGVELKPKRAGRKVSAKSEKTEAKVEVETKKSKSNAPEASKEDKGLVSKVSKSLKSTFTQPKERARTRSGL